VRVLWYLAESKDAHLRRKRLKSNAVEKALIHLLAPVQMLLCSTRGIE
jgi:hypothetical protein